MRYSQMSEEQRHFYLDGIENYPLRVAFLGKRGILTLEEVSFLRGKNVDFDVDDQQIEEMEAETIEKGEAPPPPRGTALRLLSIIVALLLLLWRTVRRG